MTRRLLRTTLAIAALAALGIACSGGNASAPGSDSAPSAAQADYANGGYDAAAPQAQAAPPRSADLASLNAVQAGVQRLTTLASFRATVVIDTTGGDKIEGAFEFASPDRYHLTISGGVPLEVISIGPASYVKAGGRWQAAEPTFLPFAPRDVLAQLAAVASKADGIAQPGAAGCVVYKTPDAEFCVDKDGPLRRASFKDGATTVKVEFSDFDSKIEIKAPL